LRNLAPHQAQSDANFDFVKRGFFEYDMNFTAALRFYFGFWLAY
jgi:hypothetical protein